MGQTSTIGLDIAKHIFQAHGADASGNVVFRKRLARTKLLGFLAAQSPCIMAMQACAGSHYWAACCVARLSRGARIRDYGMSSDSAPCYAEAARNPAEPCERAYFSNQYSASNCSSLYFFSGLKMSFHRSIPRID